MKKIYFIYGVFFLLLLITLTACGNKTAITTNDFKSKVESLEYTTSDAIEQFSAYTYVKEATVAQSPDGFQIEFYVLEDASYATSMFNSNKTTFENSKGNSSIESSANIGNYSSYSLTSNGTYMYICRVDNTLLYLRINDTYKDAVKSLIQELGY